MKKKVIQMGFASLGLFLIFWCQPVFAATTEDVMKRLDDLTEIIQKQQEEIKRLKNELQTQKQSIEKGQQVQKKKSKKRSRWKPRKRNKPGRIGFPSGSTRSRSRGI